MPKMDIFLFNSKKGKEDEREKYRKGRKCKYCFKNHGISHHSTTLEGLKVSYSRWWWLGREVKVRDSAPHFPFHILPEVTPFFLWALRWATHSPPHTWSSGVWVIVINRHSDKDQKILPNILSDILYLLYIYIGFQFIRVFWLEGNP